jgi:NADH-quinone oxidoreductase subunit A
MSVSEARRHVVADVSTTYAIAAAVLAVALGLGLFTLRLGRWLGPRPRPSTENPPPEHGGRTGHKTWVQFLVRYAVLALLFVAFDMEMVYMFPWAVVFKRLGLVAFVDMFVFIAILAAAIVFAWKEGAFDWED